MFSIQKLTHYYLYLNLSYNIKIEKTILFLNFTLKYRKTPYQPLRPKGHHYLCYDFLKINLLKAYENINCYKEVPTTLSKLKEREISTAILSNASPNMLHMAIKNSKIDSHIDCCFSADSLKIYKPHPTVYNLVLEEYDLNKNEILFVSSNSWDIAGAKSFGFNVCWINRFNNKKEVLPFESDIELKSLMDLLNIL